MDLSQRPGTATPRDPLLPAEPGDQAGDALKAIDWARHPLGPPAGWPVPLRTLVGVMLGSKQPMFLAWGPDAAMLYNSAYAQILGEKHPAAMGRPLMETWAEAEDVLQPIVREAYDGRPVHMDHLELRVRRGGRLTEAWFSFSYTPIAGGDGQVAGFFCACQETTGQVLAERRARLDREQQLRALRQMPGFAATLSGPDHRFDYANDAYLKLVGNRDVVGRTVVEALPEVVGQGFVGLLDKVFTSGEPHVAHATPIILEGEQRFIDFLYHPVVDEDGAVTGIFVGGYDVTEQELGRARFRAVQDTSAAGFMLLDSVRDRSGRIVDFRWSYVNEAAGRIVGRPREAFLGRALLSEMPGNREEGLFDAYVAVVETGEPWTSEVSYAHEGLDTYLLVSAAKVWDGVAISFIDLSERRRAELKLEETLRLLTSFTEAVPGVVYAKDREGRFLVGNRGTSELIGMPPDQWLGKTDAECLDDSEQARRVMQNDSRIMETGVPEQVEELVQLPDGTPAWWLSTKAPMRDAEGRVVGLVGSSVDITARKAAEAALKASQAELRMLNETLEQRVQQALAEREQAQEALRQSQKLESMGQLTGGVAHDFNNLLTPIIGSLDLLQRRGRADEREARLLAGALQSAERAKTLVQRLLAFARRQPLQTRAVNMGALMQGMAELIASTSGPRVRVEMQAADGLPPVSADPNQLEMAILNLAVNARDAMPDGGTLTISADPAEVGPGHRSGLAPGRYVRLCVADTGIGMDEPTRRRAIEPFFSTKGVGQGTGLGLSMAHGLAAQLGGSLTIESRKGEGTSIEIWLPCALSAAPEAAEDGPAEPEAGAGTVLLVDDEELVRGVTADMLEDLNYRVVCCGSAEAALKLFAEGPAPDFVVTDHLMPGMTGQELARALRAKGFAATLIISGYARDEGISPDLPRLTKPFRQAELAAALAELRPRLPRGLARGGEEQKGVRAPQQPGQTDPAQRPGR